MIDLHCHILPGVDDGAKTIEDSLDMARLAVEEGITHILATPHHKNRNWNNEKTDVIQLVNQLQKEIDQAGIELTIFPGQEVRIYGEILQDIKEDKILFIDEQRQYLLIEFPTSNIPTYTERLFYDLLSEGITPIVVHPERNREILEHPNRLKTLVDKGALAQLTAASYTGGFGKQIQKLSEQLVEANLVHFIASDAHNIGNRAFHMQEAFDKLRKEFGRAKANDFKQVTKDLVNGEVVVAPTASLIKKKKFFGLF
jgi:protein-tyrosine phosphatase